MFSATETDKNTKRKINRHCSGYSLFTLIYCCDLSYPILSYSIRHIQVIWTFLRFIS